MAAKRVGIQSECCNGAEKEYSAIHIGGPLTTFSTARNLKFLTAGLVVKSKKEILMICDLVK